MNIKNQNCISNIRT